MFHNNVITADRQSRTGTAAATAVDLATRAKVIQARERAMARSLARDYLSDACNQALFHLLSGLSRSDSPEKVRIGLLASEMLREEVDATRSRLSREANPEAWVLDKRISFQREGSIQ